MPGVDLHRHLALPDERLQLRHGLQRSPQAAWDDRGAGARGLIDQALQGGPGIDRLTKTTGRARGQPFGGLHRIDLRGVAARQRFEVDRRARRRLGAGRLDGGADGTVRFQPAASPGSRCLRRACSMSCSVTVGCSRRTRSMSASVMSGPTAVAAVAGSAPAPKARGDPVSEPEGQ